MIIVKLIGGLGNQMFQYALGRQLAEKHHGELLLDISAFENHYKLHRYSLNHFNIDEKIVSQADLDKFKPSGLNKITDKLFGKTDKYQTIKELHFHFDPKILDLPDDIYLDGYWQSERYFKSIETIIRKNFTLKQGNTELDQNSLGSIGGTESVSLHIRRADYVTNQKTLNVHGVCSPEYYYSAIEQIQAGRQNLRLFVFSDDIKWAKTNLKFDLPATYIDHGPEKNYEDLILMSRCKHNIIANSSFSWWAAWLNQNPDKIVIAPKNWFLDETRNTKDLLPEKWIKL